MEAKALEAKAAAASNMSARLGRGGWGGSLPPPGLDLEGVDYQGVVSRMERGELWKREGGVGGDGRAGLCSGKVLSVRGLVYVGVCSWSRGGGLGYGGLSLQNMESALSRTSLIE